ncbi:unnamed protein product [Menidia menidia]|uniref:(Atlantic silverside) hypothetical protein n=1 Tax=Menidia menidia TaxID=238744 RepID=A0A8S4AW19_9TELE|nr:unnamed protein product [Menidia menidia]
MAILRDPTLDLFGCGNSSMSGDMYRAGYHAITNIDYSWVCISNMSARYSDCPSMTWKQMDVRQLAFSDASFDVILEKATLDAIMVEEKTPWEVSPESACFIHQALMEHGPSQWDVIADEESKKSIVQRLKPLVHQQSGHIFCTEGGGSSFSRVKVEHWSTREGWRTWETAVQAAHATNQRAKQGFTKVDPRKEMLANGTWIEMSGGVWIHVQKVDQADRCRIKLLHNNARAYAAVDCSPLLRSHYVFGTVPFTFERSRNSYGIQKSR